MATIPIVDTQDKRIGFVSSVAAMVLLLIILLIIQYEIADPPPENFPLQAAEPIDQTIISDFVVDAGGGGGGNPSSDPVNNPQTTEQIITQANSPVKTNSGNANNTTTPNSDNPPAGNNTDDPFSGGWGGGTGGGTGTGTGTGVGSDSGPGSGPGTGTGGGNRTLLAGVNANDIRYNHDVKFYFSVTINEDGYVIDVRNIKSKTTTSDVIIIRKVIELVKKQVRYSKSPGARPQTLEYNVNFKAV